MKRYTYNLNVLNAWSTGLAYVLGLALTDGSVHKDLTRISFYSSDQQMLEIGKELSRVNSSRCFSQSPWHTISR